MAIKRPIRIEEVVNFWKENLIKFKSKHVGKVAVIRHFILCSSIFLSLKHFSSQHEICFNALIVIIRLQDVDGIKSDNTEESILRSEYDIALNDLKHNKAVGIDFVHY